MPSVREERNDLQCNICQESFTQKQTLESHVSSVHEGRKHFQQCNLKIHTSSVHEERNDFQCKICQKSVTQKANFLSHMCLLFMKVKNSSSSAISRYMSSIHEGRKVVMHKYRAEYSILSARSRVCIKFGINGWKSTWWASYILLQHLAPSSCRPTSHPNISPQHFQKNKQHFTEILHNLHSKTLFFVTKIEKMPQM